MTSGTENYEHNLNAEMQLLHFILNKRKVLSKHFRKKINFYNQVNNDNWEIWTPVREQKNFNFILL